MNDAPDNRPSNRRRTFSIKSFLIVMVVFCATAVCLGNLYRASIGVQGAMGQFIILTAMMPMLVLVGASWFFKIFGSLFN